MLRSKILKIKYLILQTTLTAKINEVKGEIPSITNLATTAPLNAKINEVKGKIPNTTSLTSTTVLTAVENNILNFSNLVKKTDYDEKILGIKSKYFTTADYNRFRNEKSGLKIKKTN